MSTIGEVKPLTRDEIEHLRQVARNMRTPLRDSEDLRLLATIDDRDERIAALVEVLKSTLPIVDGNLAPTLSLQAKVRAILTAEVKRSAG